MGTRGPGALAHLSLDLDTCTWPQCPICIVLGMEAQWLARLYPEAFMSLWGRVTENIVVTMGNNCQEEKCSGCWAVGAVGGGTGGTVQQEAEITEISEGGHGGRLG